jgi:hypothetical protein
LNNYLSTDYIRQHPLGHALMMAKNLTTAVELAVSPFHLFFEGIESMGSQLALGVQRFWNNGVRLGNGGELIKGMKEMSTFIAAPYMVSRAGGSILRYAKNPNEFLQTPRGQQFIKEFPDAPRVVAQLFNGGLTWGVNRDYRFDPEQSLVEAYKTGNYVGAVLRAVPWINTMLMKPLFGALIPRLKWGFALQQYSQQMIDHQAAIADGDMTESQVVRDVVDTVENRFGEMNFDNIFWNNTFKSVMQLLFRSVTWKLGNWRGAVSAIGPEMVQSFRDPLKAMREDYTRWKAGNNDGGNYHRAGEYLPRIGNNQAWLIGVAFTTAFIGAVLSKTLSGKWPWEWVDEDRQKGQSLAGAIALETVHPRTGRINEHTGKPERISLPTGMKDFEHAFRDPRSYAKSSMSGMAAKAIDTWENKDSFGNYVYDPHGKTYEQLRDIFGYNMPEPMSIKNLTDKYGAQDATSKTLRAAGIGNASADLDMTPAEQRLRDTHHHDPLTPEQVKQREEKNVKPTKAQLRSAARGRNLDYLQRLFKAASYADARDVFENYATPAQQKELRPLLAEKRANYLKKKR